MFKWIDILRNHLSDWRDERYLEKHGCSNWEEFYYKYDGDINRQAYTAEEFYKDYTYVYCYDQKHCDIYYRDYFKEHEKITAWCKENCNGKWRTDILRGILVSENFILNEMSGWDMTFYAFKQESDYLWFLMRWS